MKTIKINYIAIALAAGLLTFTSCEKRLEEVTAGTSIPQQAVLTDPNAAVGLYNGLYSSFRTYHSALFTLGEMRSEIWADGLYTESEDAGAKQYYTHNISRDNVPATEWAGFYNLIDRLNTVITLFPQSPLEAAKRDRYLAEAYGMRAYVYYTLLKTWGGVPISTTPVTGVSNLPELYRERAKPEDVMKLIKEDIEQSLRLFNGDNSFNPLSSKRIYWSRPATLTLKGDVYLWSATNFNGGTADLTTAKQALEEVKNQPTLGLNANYADNFNPDREVNNKEILFAINFEKDQATISAYGNILVNTTQAGTLYIDPATGQTVANAYPLVAGASRIGLSPDMINKLTSGQSDQRISNTFRVMYRKSGNTYSSAGVLLTKFIGKSDAGIQVYSTDFPVYRYADVLLMLAEAKTKLGEDPSIEINAIRERAYGSGYTPLVNGSVQQNMAAILEENLREFIGEGKRWWALRRAGNEFVFQYINPQYLAPSNTYKLLLPISRDMLNLDPKLEQTPGY
ncbi:RagB/SusD family nutrient uptake outer membrane protein [Chitinophagaceae bacterium LB-8]|uniref:RagB/SusD family nutrient uptake outer membrane protein n=1 Tax=Paraflavisolibacter caeni TaxID=2982496 RepID=A0A9X2XXA5_9BACT|nr:RagB/SusD family nutrient uptake outer membrane protein [Paraflavisolibacter caeni]MCU7550456.1 RagB/SusD family nutrient uptake outer membrane protein [Paraflavisolibacter caeni]